MIYLLTCQWGRREKDRERQRERQTDRQRDYFTRRELPRMTSEHFGAAEEAL